MRDIKFRQYYTGDDGSDPEWNYFDLRSGHMTIDGGYMDAQQYTGLTDKNGVEIYEGDIVHKWDTYSGNDWRSDRVFSSVQSIEFINGQFVSMELGCPEGLVDLYNSETTTMEVIGNIYENPELLKENK